VSRPARKPDEKLSDERLGEPSADIRERVEAARERQRGRFEGTSLMSNAAALARARVGPGEVRDYCQAVAYERPGGTTGKGWAFSSGIPLESPGF
jgi:hypothetical protein